jgi:hypothetical protein
LLIWQAALGREPLIRFVSVFRSTLGNISRNGLILVSRQEIGRAFRKIAGGFWSVEARF